MCRFSFFPLFWCLILFGGCDGNESLRALGTIERDRVLLKANANETIVALPLVEGQFVKAGTLLVQLDDRRQKARVAHAKAELANARAQWELLRNGARIEDIDGAKAQVEGAEAAVTVAEKSYARALELKDKNLGSQSNLDQALANRDSAQAALKSAQKHLLALTNGTRKEQLDQAEAVFEAASAQLELEQLQLEELSITATRDGYLDSLPWNRGERVLAGTTVAVLLADAAPFARVYVPEPLRTRLHIGDTVQIHVDGISAAYTGTLRWVANDPAFTPYFALNERDRARLMYLAEVDLPEGTDLPIGIPAEAHFRDGE